MVCSLRAVMLLTLSPLPPALHYPPWPGQMACSLRAERRWVMTGTPTPATPSSNTAHLQPLLAFLRHDPYGLNRRWVHSSTMLYPSLSCLHAPAPTLYCLH